MCITGTTSMKNKPILKQACDVHHGMEVFVFYAMHWSIPVAHMPLGVSKSVAHTLVACLGQVKKKHVSRPRPLHFLAPPLFFYYFL